LDTDHITELVVPLVRAAGLALYDVEEKGATLRISIDGVDGVEFGALERLSREISLTLDEADMSAGSYTLEVSTPGVERNLRLVDHFLGAVGELITLKTKPGPHGRLRYRGELVSVDDATVVIDDEDQGRVGLGINEIESARTIFKWGPTPKQRNAQSGTNRNQRRAS